jgi:L-amino acid N-acyltransferase YncA
MQVRPATASDAVACAALYAPYVTDTPITFELSPPAADVMAERIAAAHAWVVAEDDGAVVGYAYAVPFATRPAYAWSCEVSVFAAAGRRRTGTGRALYAALLPALREQGLRAAVARVTLPNDASLGLHRAFGFAESGVLRRIGFKAGAWHDVWLGQLELEPGDHPPAGA